MYAELKKKAGFHLLQIGKLRLEFSVQRTIRNLLAASPGAKAKLGHRGDRGPDNTRVNRKAEIVVRTKNNQIAPIHPRPAATDLLKRRHLIDPAIGRYCS